MAVCREALWGGAAHISGLISARHSRRLAAVPASEEEASSDEYRGAASADLVPSVDKIDPTDCR